MKYTTENLAKNVVIKHDGCSTCKYHRNQGCETQYNLNNLAPDGMCLELANAAYPYALAILYGADFGLMGDIHESAVHAKCPGFGRSVHFKVYREDFKEPLKSELLPKGKKCLVWIEIVGTDTIREDPDLERGCGCEYEPGTRWEFNQGDRLNELCPAALHEMWPTLKSMLDGGKNYPRKSSDPDTAYVSCPDNFGLIVEEGQTMGPIGFNIKIENKSRRCISIISSKI